VGTYIRLAKTRVIVYGHLICFVGRQLLQNFYRTLIYIKISKIVCKTCVKLNDYQDNSLNHLYTFYHLSLLVLHF
jgi:hypothetical protein